jgi:hypothetical protein
MKRFLIRFGGSLCFLTSLVLHGQGMAQLVPAVPAGRIVSGVPVGVGQSIPPEIQARMNASAPPAGGAPPPNNAPQLPNEDDLRLQKFLKLSFDRRASVILKELTKRTAGQSESKTSEPTPPQDQAPAKSEPANDAQEAAQQTAELNKRLDEELKEFQLDVTLGNWEAIRGFYASIKTNHVQQTFQHLVQGLSRPAGLRPNQPLPPNQARRENHVMALEDLVGLADAYPMPLTDSHARSLGGFSKKNAFRGL